TPTLDQALSAHGTTGTAMATGASATLAAAISVAVAYFSSANGASAAGSGWNTSLSGEGVLATSADFAEHQITSTTAAINGQATQATGEWRALMMIFYDSTGPSPITGTSSQTIPAFSQTASATVTNKATVSQTVAAFTQSTTGFGLGASVN